jgi:hypothetical protein
MSQLGFKPLDQRIVGIGIVLACVPPLLDLPSWVVAVGGACIIGGATGGVSALVRERR